MLIVIIGVGILALLVLASRGRNGVRLPRHAPTTTSEPRSCVVIRHLGRPS